jgi:hypothetical protein
VAINPSLNACIDRKYFQQKVNRIKKDRLEQIELELADEIVEGFENEMEV